MYLHGRQRQQKRLEVFESFVRRPGACCLISTDLASRGIDFTHVAPSSQKKKIRGSEGQRPGNASFSRESETELCRKESKREKTGGPRQTDQRTEESTSVDFVVQMDCPDSVDTYIHRVGRTARMQRKGRALLMLLPSEQLFVSRLKEKKVRFLIGLTVPSSCGVRLMLLTLIFPLPCQRRGFVIRTHANEQGKDVVRHFGRTPKNEVLSLVGISVSGIA